MGGHRFLIELEFAFGSRQSLSRTSFRSIASAHSNAAKILRNFVLALAFLLLAALPSNAAVVSGMVWDVDRGVPADGVAVEVNTTPMQRDVTDTSGKYTFWLDPGRYALIVKKVNASHELEEAAIQQVEISAEGNYTVDILIISQGPAITDIGNETEPQFLDYPPMAAGEQPKPDSLPYLVPALAALAVVVFAFLMTWKGEKAKAKPRPRPAQREQEAKPLDGQAAPAPKTQKLPGDLREIVRILKKNDGRMTQKELRKFFPLSEAKVSLMLADLESRGAIRRVKQGRGNIIFLEDG